MKYIKFLLVSISALIAVSCTPEPEIKDTISLTSTQEQLDFTAQTVEITVTSSCDWTMTGEYDWITPSATAGISGDKVSFNIQKNRSGGTREGKFTFTAGQAETT